MSENLTTVVLSHNSLTGSITSAHWGGLNKLAIINLRNNLLNGNIPSSLFQLPSLEQLQLSNNQFDGQLPQFENVSMLPLEILDLSSNNLEGSIPMSIFNFEKLHILLLSFNNLSGMVRIDHILGLHNLATLDLSYNSLSVVGGDNGSSWSSFSKLTTLRLASCKMKNFPNLKNHPMLVTLDLSNNQIHGEVPNWVWELGNGFLRQLNLSCNSLVILQEPYTLHSFLDVLDLHRNQIRGSVPVLPLSAAYIDFSSNNFSSSIPPDVFKNLSVLFFLSLSNNNLTGVVPESLCNAISIQILDLSHNGLSGGIPACIPSTSLTLRVLNLQRNRFTGPIPDTFPANCGLKTLNLNGNLVKGKIPNSLVNCAELEVLNLGNNNLSDKFPCVLKSISTLRVLVLRSNNFSGRIGCHNSSGTWKMLQIVDLAHNSFGEEIPGKSLTTWQAMHDDEEDVASENNHIRFQVLKFSNVYYQDAVTITSKGLDLEFVKILTVFTVIDLSHNNFFGKIPEELGLLGALYVLNLSHNDLTGQIPLVIGNLRHLESLDLSQNKLSGPIPTSLGSLNFLSFLNLSFNELAGMIPKGSQIQTFSEDSFIGNEGLCGLPLRKKCSAEESTLSPNREKDGRADSRGRIDWNLLSAEIGFIVGFGLVVAPLVYLRRFRKWYFERIDGIFVRIFPPALARKWFQWTTS